MGVGEPGDAVVSRIRSRLRTGPADAGVTLIEIFLGMAVGMIGFALVGTVLVTAQKQERIASETARTVDEARLALSSIANEVREARGLYQQGSDAAAWFDHDRDGAQDLGEVEVYGLRPDGSLQMLVRDIDGVVTPILREVFSGSFVVTMQRTGLELAMTITLPADPADRGGVTLTSKVVNRGNG